MAHMNLNFLLPYFLHYFPSIYFSFGILSNGINLDYLIFFLQIQYQAKKWNGYCWTSELKNVKFVLEKPCLSRCKRVHNMLLLGGRLQLIKNHHDNIAFIKSCMPVLH